MLRKWITYDVWLGVALLSCFCPTTAISQQQIAIDAPQNALTVEQELERHLEAQQAAKDADNSEQVKVESRVSAALALRLLASSKMQQSDWTSAIQYYAESLDTLESSETRFDLALSYVQGQKPPEAEKQLRTILANAPTDYRAWTLLGRVASAQGNYSSAVDSFTHALQLHPEVRTAFSLAETLLAMKEKERADEIFHGIFRSAGEHADLHMMVGTAYLNADCIPDAIREFEATLSLDQNLTTAHVALGYAYWVLNQYQYNVDSWKEFSVALEKTPDDYYANYYLGQLQSQVKHVTDAATRFQMAARADPTSPDPWLYLGLDAFSIGDYGAAKTFLEKSVLLTGTQVQRNGYQIVRAYMALSRIAASQANTATARSMYASGHALKLRAAGAASVRASTGMVIVMPDSQQRTHETQLAPMPLNSVQEMAAAKTSPSSPQPEPIATREAQLRQVLASSFNDWGATEARAGNYEVALPLFQKAEKWDPKLPLVAKNVGLAAFRLGNLEESVRAFKLAVAADRQDDRSRSLLVQASAKWADALSDRGKLSQAAMVLEEASATAPEEQEIHKSLVRIYRKLGRTTDARRHLQALERLKPTVPSDRSIDK